MTVIKKYNENTTEWEAIAVGQKGDTGEGLVTGGTTNQILTKLSNTDFDTQWVSDIDIDSVTQDKAVFNIPLTAFTPAGAGEAQWNIDEGTLDIGLDGAISLHVGQETLYYVKNQTGSQINVGTLVCANGTLGNSGRILITPWTGAEVTQTIMGLTTENIADGADGYVTHFGKLPSIDTTGTPYSQTWADGDIIYAGPSGGLTNVKPSAPDTKTVIALVIKANATGTLFVRPSLSSSIGDDDLVEITSISDNDILRYNSANGRFENESLGTLADQDSDSVSITGGSVSGITDLAVADGGTGASDASGARTNLGLGTIATQDADSVNIDGGTIDGTAVNATTLTASGDVNFDSGTLFVDASADAVGIGTTSPSAKLDVVESEFSNLPRFTRSTTLPNASLGALRVKALTAADMINGFGAQIAFSIQDTEGVQNDIGFIGAIRNGADNSGAISLSTVNAGSQAEAMRIDSSGNVGVGTTSPSSLLQLTGDTAQLTIEDNGSYSANSVSSRLQFNGRDAIGVIRDLVKIEASQHAGASGTGSLDFATRISGSVASRMRIDQNGNVGIGISSPTLGGGGAGTVLHINDSSQAQIHLTNSISGSTTADGFNLGAEGVDVFYNNREAGNQIFFNNGTERMRIDSSGNVGIGTTAPNARLTIDSDFGQNSISSPASLTGYSQFHYRNLSLSDDHTAIDLGLGTYTYFTCVIEVVITIGGVIETTATLWVDSRETTVTTTNLGGINSSNVVAVNGKTGTDNKFNICCNSENGDSYLAIRNRMGGTRRVWVAVRVISAR